MATPDDHARLRGAWQGRISGCMLGKPIEVLSMRKGHEALTAYLEEASALPLRDYVPFNEREPLVAPSKACCRQWMTRSEPDDDIHYSVLALMMLERHGRDLSTAHVAQSWLRNLPAAATYTAERAAYRILLTKGDEWFAERGEPGFDLAECADNPYNDWIGAQIRADVYGWVAPGDPELAARLATADAALSHRGDGIGGAVFVAVAGSQIPVCASLDEAVERTLPFLESGSGAREAVELGIACRNDPEGGARIRARYANLSPVHTLNNLAIVVWSLLSHPDDFGAAIGDAVAAGLDTDCNGATVGGLWGLQGKPIPAPWLEPWQGRVGVNLAGQRELSLDDLAARTLSVMESLRA
ncbi:MAG: ADP-ribosylglycohydrolase family protein [Gammaproteobacteria bacterium]|nr:ADP-ribosylglycohydrolase family protein [Gammaproteobacteria bacterium]MYK27753.1 ADP-ribosylglycohydrolase family protein [Gammaproteobacteria bacterium]